MFFKRFRKTNKNQPITWRKLFKLMKKETFGVYLPVTSSSFGYVSEEYESKVKRIVEEGRVFARHTITDDCIELRYCIDDGGYGDCDGYGVEPSIWLFAKMDFEGRFIEPFHLNR